MRVFAGIVLGSIVSVAAAHAAATDDIERTLSKPVRQRLSMYKAGAAQADYQAMRNTAYVWSTDAALENKQAPAIGCAWYTLIMDMHKRRVHEGDESNQRLYCERLTIDQARAAGAFIFRIRGEIESAAR